MKQVESHKKGENEIELELEFKKGEETGKIIISL